MLKSKKDLKPFSAANNVPNLLGTWTNELQSTMTITSVTGGNFVGTYASAVSTPGGSVTGTLSGAFSGNAISFVVNWGPALASTSAWSGLILTDGSPDLLYLYTLWNVAETPDQPGNWWESILAGSDFFVKISP